MAAKTPQCLFPFYTIGLALGDEPTLAPHSAEDAALDDLLAETLQQLILVLIRSQNYACHVLTPSRVYDSFELNHPNGNYFTCLTDSCQWGI